ncbi:MAG: hypothetical protein IPM17_13690 [Verrucomicrobia bacterium]|nr:hypothetical protein [Verrucomicrobiota bacterium]
MKRREACLNRLLRAAARAPQREVPALSWATETRVLAAWRANRAAGDDTALLNVLRRGLAFACALMLISLTLSLTQVSRSADPVWNDPSALVTLAYTR